MNAAQERYRLPQMKASDADRDAVVAALSEHFQTGRLTREELDERTGRALTARTLDELDELTADLPAIRPAGPAPVVRPRGLGHPLLAPVAAALAALAIAALVLGVGEGHQGWDWWWVIPASLLFARRAGRDTPTLADGDAMVFRPGPDIAAALAAGRAARRSVQLNSPRLAGMLEERCELLAEGDGVLGAEVDLIVRATEAEPYGLIGWAAVNVVLPSRRYGHGLEPPGKRGPRWLFDLFIIAPRDVLRHRGNPDPAAPSSGPDQGSSRCPCPARDSMLEA